MHVPGVYVATDSSSFEGGAICSDVHGLKKSTSLHPQHGETGTGFLFTLALSSMRSIGHQPLSATRPTFGLSTCIYPRHSKFLISVPMSLLQLFLLPRGLHFRACRAMLVLSFRMVGLSDSISASQSVFPLVPLICS